MKPKQDIMVGTSGFSYKDWLGNFYPQFCPRADYLQFYSSRFSTVEIDSTFYRIPAETVVQRWYRVTPDRFVFAAKFPRSVTHEGDLATRLDDMQRFFEVMRALKEKQGPLLLQFPYSFTPDEADLLQSLLEALPAGVRVALEFRNKKWLQVAEVFETMRQKNVAFCLIDHPWMPRLKISTADFSYIRLLGDRKKIECDFTYLRDDRQDDLEWWRDAVRDLGSGGRQSFIYINNHYTGHSPTTAARMIEMLRQI
ncbi:MAG: DUF72 domain-containing protein [bacterium]